MERKPIQILFIVLMICFSGMNGSLGEDLLTIDGYATVSISNGTLDLDCADVKITSGSTLRIENVTIENLGRLDIESGGNLIRISAITKRCHPLMTPMYMILLD